MPLIALSIGAVLSCAFASTCDAAPDVCDTIGLRGLRPAARVELQREAAMKIVVHLKRACGLIGRLQTDHPESGLTRPLTLVGARLNAQVLAPIYRAYPDLRGLTAAEPLSPPTKSEPGARPSIGGATATYLRWTLSNAQRSLAGLPRDMCKGAGKGAGEACIRPMLDLISEIGFAEKPVYASYPRLFVLDMKETDRRTPGRTAKSDAEFRKAVAKAGTVEVTPAALKVVRGYLAKLAKDVGPRCEVGAFLWTLGGRSKGPDDTEWKTSGPEVSFGSYACRQLPPDVVRRIDGLPIVIGGEQFFGKRIDWENGKFVLKERDTVPTK